MKLKKIIVLLLVLCGLIGITSCAKEESNPNISEEQVEKIVPVFEGINLVDNKDIAKVSKKKPIDLIPSIGEDSHVKYYASAGSKAEVEVHLYNPVQFEILSFTLNERKYQSFEFKEGSNSEKLIIDVEMPKKPGEYQYQIEAIKYIDKQAIKDVNMENGNKFIEFGITYNSLPTVTISNEIVTTKEYSADVNVVDNDNYLEDSSGLRAYLFENDNISKILKIEDRINFTELKEGYSYSYAIATSKDELDGNGNTTKILFEQSFDTLSMFNVINVKATYDSVSYEIKQTNSEAVIKNIFLIDGEENLDITNLTTVNNLLSNHEYKIKVVYDYKGNIKETIKKFNTLAYGTPSILGFNTNVFKDQITFDYEIKDESNVVKEEVVRIYKDNVKLKEVAANSKEVTGLLSNTLYRIDLVLRYDLNDGSGINEVIETKEETTLNLAKPVVNIIYNIKDVTFEGELVLIDTDNTFNFIRYELCDKDGKVIKTLDDIKLINNLKRNTNYNLKLVYSYNVNDGNGDVKNSFILEFTTTKQVPTLEINPYYVNETSFGIDIYETDPNVIGEVSAIRLFNELGEFIKQVPADMQFVFDTLVANTKYEVRIYYTYDLNDGNGNQEVIYKYEITTAKTKPNVDFELESDKYSLTIKPNINDINNAGSISNIVVKLKEDIVYQGTDLKVLNLLSNNNYSVTLTYTYDLNDLNGQKEIVVSKEIQTKSLTKPTITLNSENITYNSFDLTYDLIDEDNIFKFISGKVFYNGKESQGFNLDNLNIADLYSNGEYEVRLEYGYDLNDGKGKITENTQLIVRTLKFDKASVKFINMSATETEIYFDFIKNDSNNNLKIVKVELFEANNLDKPLKELTDVSTLKFDGLTKSSFYKLVVTYTYDLNDGNGITDKFSQDYGTIGSKLLIKNVEVINDNVILVNETSVHVRVYFENPNNLNITGIYLDNELFSINQQDIYNQFVTIELPPFTKGGRLPICVNAYEFTVRNSEGETIKLRENLFNNFASQVSVLGDLNLEYYGSLDEKPYILENEYGVELRFDPQYIIDQISLGHISNVITYSDSEIKVIKPGIFRINPKISSINFNLHAIKYSLDGMSTTKTYNIVSNYTIVSSLEKKEIKNASDLNNLENYRIYEIVKDLDFTNVKLGTISFNGVLLGNSHKLSNIKFVGTKATLFESFRGYAADLIFINPYISCNSDNAAVLASSAYGTFERICIFNPFIDNSGYCTAGLICITDGICGVNINSVAVIGGEINGKGDVAGIINRGSSSTIKNCYNSATINGRDTCAGIAIFAKNIVNCINAGTIGRGGKNADGGISAYKANVEQGCVILENVLGKTYEKKDLIDCFIAFNKNKFSDSYSIASIDELNDKSWWISIGYDETIWNLDNLDYENGLYPTLRFLSK